MIYVVHENRLLLHKNKLKIKFLHSINTIFQKNRI